MGDDWAGADLYEQGIRLGENSGNAAAATLHGQVVWGGKPEIDDDDGGTAGVREPRRPRPVPPFPPAAAAVEPESVGVR